MELLTHQYPIGTVIECWLMYGQKRPSKGTVISYSGGRYGVINVKLDSRKQKVCPVPASKIVENGA